jgi:hypothetical protein
MKKQWLIVAMAVLFGSVVVDAQISAFVVSIKGTITQEDGATIQVKDVAKDVSALLPTNTNILVLFFSQNDNKLEVDEVDPATTNIVRGIFANTFTASLDSGKFDANLIAHGGGPQNSVTNFPSPIPAFNGVIMADGKVVFGTKASIKAKLVGVWKDPSFSPVSTNAPAAVFKGTLISTRTNDVPGGCCLTF